MSSFIRRMQRAAKKAQDPMARTTPYMGRGFKLGVKNPKDPCVTGKRKKRPAWRSKAHAPQPKAKPVLAASLRVSSEDRAAAHADKIGAKVRVRTSQHLDVTDPSFAQAYGANINLHTGKPHKHEREIARRLRQRGER